MDIEKAVLHRSKNIYIVNNLLKLVKQEAVFFALPQQLSLLAKGTTLKS